MHSFIVEDNGGTWSRLNYVLENDVSVKGFFILMILSLIITIIIVIDKYRKRKFEEEAMQYDSIEKILSEDNTFFAAIYTLSRTGLCAHLGADARRHCLGHGLERIRPTRGWFDCQQDAFRAGGF